MTSRRRIAAPQGQGLDIVTVKSGALEGAKMSALGQKQTCAAQNVMSALLLIVTEKADKSGK
jgi:hypothetical protein